MGRRTHPDRPALNRFSAALTSRERLLPVVAAIEPATVVNATSLDETSGLGVVRIYHELRCLEEAGLVQPVATERATSDFEITDTDVWAALRSLAMLAADGRVGPR